MIFALIAAALVIALLCAIGADLFAQAEKFDPQDRTRVGHTPRRRQG